MTTLNSRRTGTDARPVATGGSERDRFAAEAVQAENQLKVERAMQQQIAQQIKALEEDNARLKGDLAFFESLLPTASARAAW